MADFELARGLMQLSSLSEQRKAREEERKFREMYEGPLKEKLAEYYDAYADRLLDKDLRDLEKRLKGAQADEAEAQSGISMELLDEIKTLRGGTEKQKAFARSYWFKTDELGKIKAEIDVARLTNQQLQTSIQNTLAGLQIEKFKSAQAADNLDRLGEDSAEGDWYRDQLQKRGILSEEQTKALEGTLGRKVPEKVTEDTLWKKAMDLLDRGDKFTENNLLPDAGDLSGRTKRMPPGKPKPAPTKKPEKPKEGMLTTNESMEILRIAQENQVNALDIAAGVQKLVETFPDLDRETLLEAHNLLAEGYPVEDIKKYIEERSKK